MSSSKQAKSEADHLIEIIRKIKDDRHWLHAHPEIAYQEFQTAAYIRNRMKELKIPVIDGIAGTGMVATIEGRGNSKRAIGLRADMDALPLKEANTFAHRSLKEGVMHGCGHDGHVSILLGVAEMLSMNRNFNGNVHLIFQPAEEGHSGARKMIEEGLFRRFPMIRIFALHNWPDLPAGCIGTLKGPMMASSHYLSIKINGKGGHGAIPHQATPQMTAAAHVQLGINSYLAQQSNTLHPSVVSLTRITAGDAIAVLPETVHMEGLCRLLDSRIQETFYKELPAMIKGISSAFGAEAKIELSEGYPSTVNDPSSTEIVRRAAVELGLSQQNENSGLLASMASEDFSYMLNHVSGCYFWMGQGKGVGDKVLHQSTYDFNDDILETGVALFARIVKLALPD